MTDNEMKRLMNKAGKNGIDVNKMKEAANSGNLDDFINKNLSADAAKQLKSVLSSRETAEKLLSTPQAKELMKKLMGDK